MTDRNRIEKSIVIRAPRSEVWRALTDPEAFGTWFRARIQGAFAPGEVVRATSIYPGHEGESWEMRIESVIPESSFAFDWPAEGERLDGARNTRVEFLLEDAPEGTKLTLVESGFDGLPLPLSETARRRNEEGWTVQMDNIRSHVES